MVRALSLILGLFFALGVALDELGVKLPALNSILLSTYERGPKAPPRAVAKTPVKAAGRPGRTRDE